MYKDYRNQLEFARYGIKDSIFEGINEYSSITDALLLNNILKRNISDDNMELEKTSIVINEMKVWIEILKSKPWKSIASIIQNNWYYYIYILFCSI